MARRARGEGSVYQRKDGSWVAQLNGIYRYARDEQTAKQKLYKLLARAEESKPQNITVANHLDDYLKHAQANLKPRTVKRYLRSSAERPHQKRETTAATIYPALNARFAWPCRHNSKLLKQYRPCYKPICPTKNPLLRHTCTHRSVQSP